MGQISIYSLPTLRRQILFNCIKPTNISALSSLQFTPYTHAFYLQSSSEFSEISFSSKNLHLLSSMMISYDKLQRKTILRSTDEVIIHEKHQGTPSKDSIVSSSTPKTIEPEERISIQNENNSDSAIDVNSINNNQPSK